jgi:hypothetical protein
LSPEPRFTCSSSSSASSSSGSSSVGSSSSNSGVYTSKPLHKNTAAWGKLAASWRWAGDTGFVADKAAASAAIHQATQQAPHLQRIALHLEPQVIIKDNA